MPVTYPIDMPSVPVPRNTRWQLLTQAALAKSPFTLKQQVQLHQGQAWMAEITLPRMSPEDAAAWTAFFVKLRGRYGTFYMGNWDRRTLLGSGGGTPITNSAGSPTVNNAGDREFYTTGWNPLISNLLKEGDMIQFNDGVQQRLHMVVNDASSDSNGDSTLDIEPALREIVPNLTSIVVENTKGVFRLTVNDPGWDSNFAGNHDFKFLAMEAL